MFKCPYCGQNSYARSSKKSGNFESWTAVAKHAAKCSLNSHIYIICNFYGPILIEEINKFTSNQLFRIKFPEFSGNFSSLRKRYKELTIRSITWTKEECISAVNCYYNKYGIVPKMKNFKGTNFEYPSPDIIRKLFKTWNNCIIEAGLEPNISIQNNYGITTVANDKKLYRSKLEAHFVNYFLFEKHRYEYEKPYKNHSRYYDFYLPDLDLYIEIAGGLRPDIIQEKIEINRLEEKNFVVLYPKDVYSNKTLEEILTTK